MKILFSKYWRKRHFVVIPAAVLAASLAASLWLPGYFQKNSGTETPKGDLLMEQLINNRIALPALLGNPGAVIVMAGICRDIEKDPVAAMQYLRYGAALPTADLKLLESAVAACAGSPGGESSPELRMFMRRMAAMARLSGRNDLSANVEMLLKHGRKSTALPKEKP